MTRTKEGRAGDVSRRTMLKTTGLAALLAPFAGAQAAPTDRHDPIV